MFWKILDAFLFACAHFMAGLFIAVWLSHHSVLYLVAGIFMVIVWTPGKSYKDYPRPRVRNWWNDRRNWFKGKCADFGVFLFISETSMKLGTSLSGY